MPPEAPTPVSRLTLQTLCDELLLGRSVASDDGVSVCAISEDDERAAFGWLVRNRPKWSQNNNKVDVEQMVSSLTAAPVPHRSAPVPAQRPRRVWRLRSVRAHRFAGLHLFGEVATPPPVFELRVAEGISIVQGENGSGKTSLINAVMWCLTGYIARAQRPPEPASLSLRVEVTPEAAATPDAESAPPSCNIAAIVPMPGGAIIGAAPSGSVPIDTWAEVTLVDAESGEEVSLRRSLTRNASGKVVEHPPAIELLGLDAAAIAIGTTMPALLPHIRLNEASDLGKAVAALTGLSPLRDLTVYVQKSIAKLTRELPADRDGELSALDGEYTAIRHSLSELLEMHPSVGVIAAVPEAMEVVDCAAKLSQVKADYSQSRSAMLSGARAILGEQFDTSDSPSVHDLSTNVGPALGAIDLGQLGTLASLRVSRAIASVAPTTTATARAEIEQVMAQAADFADLLADPQRATRTRLYAALASWARDTGTPVGPQCPVCFGSLDGRTDPITNRAVGEEIASSQSGNNDHLGRSLAGWASEAASLLRSCFPVELHPVLAADLPADPTVYLRTGLVDELFAQQRFTGVLAALRPAHAARVDWAISTLPVFVEPSLPELPRAIAEAQPDLASLLNRAVRLCAFIDWRATCQHQWRQAVVQVVGETTTTTTGGNQPQTLREALATLDALVKDATPLREGVAKIEALEAVHRRRTAILARKSLYARTVAALTPVLRLGALVDSQISALVSRLSDKTTIWKDRLYMPSFVGAPRTLAAAVSPAGSLSATAVRDGAAAPADEVSNASDLRATLLAFLFAFWEETLSTRGGLSTLLLDDVQDLFDETNQRRVANALPFVIEAGGQVVLVTHQRLFRVRAYRACRPRLTEQCVCLRLHPVNAARRVAALVPFIESVDEKRREFEKEENENIPQPARDYLNELRIFLEENLKDLFAVGDASLGDDSTLSDLVGAIRRRVSSGMDMFNGLQFRDLIGDAALGQGSEFLRLMNESHHSRAAAVTYVQVQSIVPDCDRVCDRVREIHEEYERWLRRDPGEERPAAPSPPAPLSLPARQLAVRAVAALSDSAPHVEGEETGDFIDLSALSHHALYLINCDNLGFAVPRGWCALVDLSAALVPDGAYVVALHAGQTYSRRLLRYRHKPEVVTLSSDAPPGAGRPPTLVLPTHDTTLLPVVGVFRVPAPPAVRVRGEALRMEDGGVIAAAQFAFRVEGDSAVPLASDGQIVLGSHLMTRDEIERRKSALVVVKTSDGAYFKRVGESIPGAPHVRQFEAVGGLGDSVLVRLDEVDNDPFRALTRAIACVAIEGVLYTTPGRGARA